MTDQSRSVDHGEVVPVKERRPQGSEEGGAQQADCDWLLMREHTQAHARHTNTSFGIVTLLLLIAEVTP